MAGMAARRSSSLLAFSLAASGRPQVSIFSRISWMSRVIGSASPSSVWMAFICSRRKYSR
jgi:hypothetical protein